MSRILDNTSDRTKIDIHGAIDVIGSRQVMGWVVDLNKPDSAIDVEVLRDGKIVERTKANLHRPDLAEIGNKSGNHGFIVNLGAPLDEGLEFTIRAFAFTTRGAVELPRLDAAAVAGGPTARVLQWLYNELVRLRAEIDEIKKIFNNNNNSRDRIPAETKGTATLDTLYHRVSMVQVQSENIIRLLDENTNNQVDSRYIKFINVIFAVNVIQIVILSYILYNQFSS